MLFVSWSKVHLNYAMASLVMGWLAWGSSEAQQHLEDQLGSTQVPLWPGGIKLHTHLRSLKKKSIFPYDSAWSLGCLKKWPMFFLVRKIIEENTHLSTILGTFVWWTKREKMWWKWKEDTWEEKRLLDDMCFILFHKFNPKRAEAFTLPETNIAPKNHGF